MSVTRQLAVFEIAVIGRAVLLPVFHPANSCGEGLEARVLPESAQLGNKPSNRGGPRCWNFSGHPAVKALIGQPVGDVIRSHQRIVVAASEAQTQVGVRCAGRCRSARFRIEPSAGGNSSIPLAGISEGRIGQARHFGGARPIRLAHIQCLGDDVGGVGIAFRTQRNEFVRYRTASTLP